MRKKRESITGQGTYPRRPESSPDGARRAAGQAGREARVLPPRDYSCDSCRMHASVSNALRLTTGALRTVTGMVLRLAASL